MMRAGASYRQPKWEHRIDATGSGLWPTPAVPNGGRNRNPANMVMKGRTWRRADGSKIQVNLEDAVRLWLTPTARDARSYGAKVVAAEMFATPQSRDYRVGQRSRWDGGTPRRNLNDQVGGKLNPNWVDWLIGFPIGWTDLEPLAMPRFRSWLQQHGIS